MAEPLEDLREAADILRGRSMYASAGPWEAGEVINGEHFAHYGDFGWVISGPAGSPECDDTEQGKADALYIATMHPLVGLAIAEHLEVEANALAWCLEHSVSPENSTERPRFKRSIALARLILDGIDGSGEGE
jgi:hypothetical protein